MAVENNIDEPRIPLNNPIEKDIDRDGYVLNQGAGSLVFSNTTAAQRVQLTHRSGANLKLDNRSYSVFSPNTYQNLTHGKRYVTTLNDCFETTQKNAEHRSYGDFRIISGSPNFFNDTIAQEWVDAYAPIANSIVTPEREIGGIGNVTGRSFPTNGRVSSRSKAVEGGSYKTSKTAKDVQKTMVEATTRLAEIERQMGKGGNIQIMSAKQLHIHAGAASMKFDTGVVVENGRDVQERFKVNDPLRIKSRTWTWNGRGGQQPVYTNTSLYTATNASGAAPFGEISITAGNKIMLKSGSGGINLNSTGEASFSANGRLSLGGAEVAIGSSTKNNGGAFRVYCDKDVFMRSNRLWHASAPESQITAEEQITLDAPKTHVTDDTYIQGPLQVHKQTIFNNDVHIDGNLHVDGTITVGGNVIVMGEVVAKAGSFSSPRGVRLSTHVHPYYWTHPGGRTTTSKPVNSSGGGGVSSG